MTTVLLTAFEPFGPWKQNSSWLTLVDLTKNLPQQPRITTRLYPVDLTELRKRLAADLEADFDYAIHLGQATGSAQIALEAIGLNVVDNEHAAAEPPRPIVTDGPVAYRTCLPLASWAMKLGQAGVPCRVSYHAGTFLCNATLYLSQYLADHRPLKTRSAFMHLPLESGQVVRDGRDEPSLPQPMLTRAVRLVLDDLTDNPAAV
jgi:pyroglutamyl-peptidase